MKLTKIDVEPEDIVPDIRFYGETNFDTEQLKNVEDVKAIAFEAIARLLDVSLDTKGRQELSIKNIHDVSTTSINDIIEYLGDFDSENVTKSEKMIPVSEVAKAIQEIYSTEFDYPMRTYAEANKFSQTQAVHYATKEFLFNRGWDKN